MLHDALVSPEILALAPQARLEPVGKRAGGRADAAASHQPAADPPGARGPSRGAAEGRRSAGVRPRRRGGVGAGGRRRPLPHRPRGSAPASAERQRPAFRSRIAVWRTASRSSPGTMPSGALPETSTGARWRAARTCWCSTWRCARSARSPRACCAAGRDADEPVAFITEATTPRQRVHDHHAGGRGGRSPPTFHACADADHHRPGRRTAAAARRVAGRRADACVPVRTATLRRTTCRPADAA